MTKRRHTYKQLQDLAKTMSLYVDRYKPEMADAVYRFNLVDKSYSDLTNDEILYEAHGLREANIYLMGYSQGYIDRGKLQWTIETQQETKL